MLFHEKSRKAFSIGFVVISILVVLSMLVFSFPAIWQQ